MDRKPPNPWLILLGGILLGVGIGMGIFVGLQGSTPPILERTSAQPPLAGVFAPGEPAPMFELTAVGGDQIRLAQLKGDVVLLNFWATWCAPCEEEMPALQRAYEAYHDQGFTVLAIDFDEPEPAVAAFGEQLGLSFPLLLDPGGEVQELYRVRGYPTSVFVDRAGTIQVYHIGVLSEDQLQGYLKQLGLDTA